MLHLQIHKSLAAFQLQIELAAPEESVTVLFGPSGSGKSMTLSAIAGFTTPDAGEISIGERVLFSSARGISLAPQQRQIGLVTQSLSLFPHLTVQQNVAYGLFREKPQVAQEKARRLLELMNLTSLAGRRSSEISGGQQQRVALARALATEPSLLLLDEPFSALDRAIRLQLRHELKSLQRELCTTMLFVTHDLAEAYILADYLAVIDQGRILQLGEPDKVLLTPATRRVAEVVGVGNILPATVLDAGRVRIGQCELAAETRPFPSGAAVHACIRPERVTLVREDHPTAITQNMLEGDIIEARSDGGQVELLFRLQPPRLLPGSLYDLQIAMPVYIYERLDLAQRRHWQVTIKPQQIHFVA